MSEFIYLTDTHVGGTEKGYSQQKPYRERMPEIIDALAEWLRDHDDVDCVLHGGDIIDETSDANIAGAVDLFARLPVPTFVCLGNHDLTSVTAVDDWLRGGAGFFKNDSPCFTIPQGDYAIHVLPSHWSDTPYHWDLKVQNAHFKRDQLEWLDTALKSNAGKLQILCTHNPVFGLPAEQTGFEEPHHPPAPEFADAVLAIVKRNPDLRLVLGAHNHMNMRLHYGSADFVTASSLTESPFEFKHVSIENASLKMRTVSLANQLRFKADYDYDKTFVQGRLTDRTIP